MARIFCTLDPKDTACAQALVAFLAFQRLHRVRIVYTQDFLQSAAELADGKIDFLVQNSAHPDLLALCAF